MLMLLLEVKVKWDHGLSAGKGTSKLLHMVLIFRFRSVSAKAPYWSEAYFHVL